jgi:hypothetical protein
MYHLGTVAFGSLLVAVMGVIKAVFEYFAMKAEASGATTNPLV